MIPDQDRLKARRWANAVLRQIDRVIEARSVLDDATDLDHIPEDVWRWRDDGHFTLVAADHLGDALVAAGLADQFREVDWTYVNHVRNAWEHDDDRGLYRRDYGWPHGSAV